MIHLMLQASSCTSHQSAAPRSESAPECRADSDVKWVMSIQEAVQSRQTVYVALCRPVDALHQHASARVVLCKGSKEKAFPPASKGRRIDTSLSKEKEGTPVFCVSLPVPKKRKVHQFSFGEPQNHTDIKWYLRVIWRHVLILMILAPGSFAAHIHPGNDEIDNLLARPQGLGLEDCRHGYPPIPVLQPHQDIHEQVLLDERVPLGHQAAPQQGVLHNSNDRLVGLHKQSACYGAAVSADSQALKCRCGIVYDTHPCICLFGCVPIH